jgi:hypothetical protein
LNTVWVLENIKGNLNSKDNYANSKLNILLLLASVYLWKKNHRQDKCILYADDLTIDILLKLKVLDFWDSIRPMPTTRRIDKEVFWASPKLEVLAQLDEPAILMDNDTHVYIPLRDFLNKDTLYVMHYENGGGYYPSSVDKYVKQLTFKRRWETDSVNVGFLHLPDPTFTKKYANQSLDIMEEFTKMGVKNSLYLIFSEQLLLKTMLEEEKIKYKPLLSTYYNCREWEWGDDHQEGIWTFKDSGEFVKHYGPLKRDIKDNKGNLNYESEISHLLNCIRLPHLDLSIIPGR